MTDPAVVEQLFAVIGGDQQDRVVEQAALAEYGDELAQLLVDLRDACVVEVVEAPPILVAELDRAVVDAVTQALPAVAVEDRFRCGRPEARPMGRSRLERPVGIEVVEVREERAVRPLVEEGEEPAVDLGRVGAAERVGVEPLGESELGLEMRVVDDRKGLVPGIPKHLGDRGVIVREHVGFESSSAPVGLALVDAVLHRVERSKEGRYGGLRPGGLRVGALEDDALVGERVDGRRRVTLVPVGAQSVGSECIDEDHEHVRRPALRASRAECRENDGDRDARGSARCGGAAKR